MIADRAAAAGLAILGLFITMHAWRLPYWLDRSPGPGFLPFWLGLLLTACATLVFIRARTPEPQEPLVLRSAPIALAVITTVAAAIAPFVGMILATAALTAVAGWRLDPRRRFAIAAATLVTPALVWIVFVRWLGVPLP
ncbi:MAG: tripartite tricarboxylate transporter TctB family protein [Vicinamibacterales bacterium]